MLTLSRFARPLLAVTAALCLQAFACVDSDYGGGHGQCLQWHSDIFEDNNMTLFHSEPRGCPVGVYNWGDGRNIAFAIEGPASTTGSYLVSTVFDDYANPTVSGSAQFFRYPNASSAWSRAQMSGTYPAGYAGYYSSEFLDRGADIAAIGAQTSFGTADAEINLSWVLLN